MGKHISLLKTVKFLAAIGKEGDIRKIK